MFGLSMDFLINLALFVLCLFLFYGGVSINREDGKTTITWEGLMWLVGALYFLVAAVGTLPLCGIPEMGCL